MNTFVSLLRGINVSGQKKIKMAELRVLYQSLGFSDVESYLQSGNVAFATAEGDVAIIAQSIEDAITDVYGYSVSVLIRDAEAIQRVFAGNPFLVDRDEVITNLYVTFLAETPSIEHLSDLSLPDGVTDEFQVVGRHVYVFCPNGYGRTKLNNAFFERKLKVAATTRNWKTVTALHTVTHSG